MTTTGAPKVKAGGFGGRKTTSPPPAGTARTSAADLDDFEKETVAQARRAGTIKLVSKKQIDRDPENPRTHFNDDSIRELAASLRDQGQIQPIIVKEAKGGRYQIIAGERRWRAFMSEESLDLVEVVIRNDVPELDVLLMQIHENEQREGMNPLDTARAYARVKAKVGTQKEAAAALKRSEATVSVYLSLLEAPEEVQGLSEQITDATTLNLVARLVKQSPEEGKAIIGFIQDGTFTEGALRQALKEKVTKKPKPQTAGTKKGEQQPRQIVVASKAGWVVDGDSRHLVIESNGIEMEIRLPADFKWESA